MCVVQNGPSVLQNWEFSKMNYVNPSGFPNPPKQWCQKDTNKNQCPVIPNLNVNSNAQVSLAYKLNVTNNVSVCLQRYPAYDNASRHTGTCGIQHFFSGILVIQTICDMCLSGVGLCLLILYKNIANVFCDLPFCFNVE